ncbi:ABC transporter ATP-binding protein [Pandoraea nosoerga]|uniref:ABC transporter n=1 Tax=Pandoraea nosoerga TaxID=2508296 RepID=A0A5E4USL4_9BURK|nr:ABC transporter ATP-binding protein [Pandoraea nosoerga]MBN4666579.1 ABC transporter ATP-binding protein [Pandoraea nosoerga]MBN4674177.1 ABC transporter ATP-binding protein [Pandoraea nosoerga]MBN4679889.1 ABC transporter ATP-binding protein [Pandoraea nosoerga]MBN4744396.1 ABC transporter ATP-binding protein [Pandoraea nosoerga]VVE02947.1 ABC transporter [Pandoraea nosoerga]
MIELKSVHLRYPLMGHYSHSLQSLLSQKVGGVLGGSRKTELVNYVHALRDISLRIDDGCRLGIVGHNGAGKTTLLRVLSGVYPPTSGEVTLRGKISALTDFTLGMEPNATGLKNIVFRLVFMGFSFREANKAVDEIVEFSELGDFINLPVRTYSTGMFLRLAFAISTHFTPDILILDEVIGAGDESFRAKAKARLDKLITSSRIVVLSSHDLGAVKSYCDRAILMEQGQIVADGTPDEIVARYTS